MLSLILRIRQKSKKRLSSLFSSSSPSPNASEKESYSSPARPSSNLNTSTSSSSGASTATREGLTPSSKQSHNGPVGKGPPPLTNGNGAHSLHVEPDPASESFTDEPEAEAQVLATVPGPPEQPTTAAGVAEPSKPRPRSMHSQWADEKNEDGVDNDDDEEDETAFMTPDEGLSEVEEENEGPVEPTTKPISDTANVERGASTGNGEVSGSEATAIRRSKPVVSETRVRRRTASSKRDALAVDQTASLPHDLDIAREVLTLFLTSKMKEAEEMCVDEDPDGNHLYLMSGHAIIQALKVRHTVCES